VEQRFRTLRTSVHTSEYTMKSILILLLWSNYVSGQNYGLITENKWPDYGKAKNFNGLDWTGNPSVVSELEVRGVTYSLIMNGEESYKVSLKDGPNFLDLIKLPPLSSGYSLDTDSKFLNIDETEKYLNIVSWGRSGYLFHFFRKSAEKPPELFRFGVIYNIDHSLNGFDKSIKNIEFPKPGEMKITKEPSSEYPETELLFEFRSDGVYRNGVFDHSARSFDSATAHQENLKTDPEYYDKLDKLHGNSAIENAVNSQERVGKSESNRAEKPPQQGSNRETKPTNIATAPSLPKPVTPAAVPVMTQNLISWLAGLVGLLVILLGYLGWRYFRKKARS
jgi:hypothetical protein